MRTRIALVLLETVLGCGSDNGPPRPHERQESADVADLYAEARAIVAGGEAMGPLRLGSSLRNVDAARQCGESQRALYPRVERLRDRCFSSTAKPASCFVLTDLFSCAGCAISGDEGCVRAAMALERADRR